MSRPFLFGGNTGAQSRSSYLVEFRAGKMTQSGPTVSPVKGRKGLVYMHQSADDHLMHFCWKDRQSGQVEDDLILFPEEAEFKRVSQCTTGRVFVLKFKATSRRFFYWSQEPKEDKDEELITKINDFINNPPTPGSRGGAGSGGLSPAGGLSDLQGAIQDSDIQGLLSNMSPQQVMSLLGGGMGASGLASLLSASTGSSRTASSASSVSTPAAPQTPATTPAVVSAATSESSLTTSGGGGSGGGSGTSSAGTGGSKGATIQLSDLQTIITGLTMTQNKDNDLNVDLSSSLTAEALQPLLANEELMRRVRETLPATGEPAGTDSPTSTASQFTSTVQSPQFQQALSTFSSALQSGQLGPLIQQFGLSQECVDAANAGDMEKFVKALQKQQQKDKEKDKKKESADKKDDPSREDDMALD